MNRNGNQAGTGKGAADYSRLTVGVIFAVVAVICGITAAVSYEHEYELAHHNGQAPWVASLLPFTVDGMILGASVALLWAAANGIRRPWRPLSVLLVGIAATIAANLASGIGDGWLGAAVAAWSGVSLILISDVAMWLTNTRRKLAAGESLRPVAACACPPPPVSLAEALVGARVELRDRGEPSGEQSLAARFGVSRHQVRTALAVPGDRGRDTVPEPGVPAAQSMNGHAPDDAA